MGTHPVDRPDGIPYGCCWCGCGGKTPPSVDSNRQRRKRKGELVRFLTNHQHRMPLRWVVEDRGHETPCWIWQGNTNENGYGHINRLDGPAGAHRYVYERKRGPIPEGMTLDHLCRVRACVNPDHLEPVTQAENFRRSPRVQLTAETVSEIRRLNGTMRREDIAVRLGVSVHAVHHAAAGRSWKDVV